MLGEIKHRWYSNSASDQERNPARPGHLKTVTEWPDDIDRVADLQLCQPMGSQTNHAMDQMQIHPARAIGSAGQRKRPSQHGGRLKCRMAIGISPTKLPIAVAIEFFRRWIVTLHLDELPRLRGWKVCQPKRKSIMFPAQGHIRADRCFKLATETRSALGYRHAAILPEMIQKVWAMASKVPAQKRLPEVWLQPPPEVRHGLKAAYRFIMH
jgi:hypothetical protein